MTVSPAPAWWRRPFGEQPLLATAHGAVLLVVTTYVFMIVRLPWVGDLGVHAATVERLRHNLFHPGNPMVDSATDSPYYSPWMVFLGLLAKVTGLGTFYVLRIAAVVGLVLLLTGIWFFTRTLTRHRAAPPLAILCVLFLWGDKLVLWSGFLGFTSLSLIVSYPSTFTLALGFHFLALLTLALRRGTATGWPTYLGLGVLWAVLMLSHQFSGVVITLGAVGVLGGARPWPAKATWIKLAAALAAGLAVLALWPYYSFFSLFGIGGLEDIHKSLYADVFAKYGLVLIGVAALVLRFVRDRRDPLVIWFALALAMVVAGAVLDKWSYGRAAPALIMPAQIAAAIAVVESGKKLVRVLFGAAVAVGLVVGGWGQKDALGLIIRPDALSTHITKDTWKPDGTYWWTTPHGKYGEVFMTTWRPAQKLPAFGFYTVAPGYPDFFLPDEDQRVADTARYFEAGTPREERLALLHKYDVTWVLQRPDEGGLPADDPALRKTATGPGGRILYRVVG
ncbi:hypothetical protein [Streptomyces sp. QHH-9511]|uniref:hypothetical protein n=1 Tax=Streptomyces sp. QHH-9511 TaxID=2684468 RepID=UPI001E5A0A10|nr:hypothetical protein [Streptomyces sp. QHH-9511]